MADQLAVVPSTNPLSPYACPWMTILNLFPLTLQKLGHIPLFWVLIGCANTILSLNGLLENCF